MEFEYLSELPKEAGFYYDNLPLEFGRKHFRASWLLALQQFPQKANQALLEASDRWPQLAGILGIDPVTGLSLINEENADPAKALAEGLAQIEAARGAHGELEDQRLADAILAARAPAANAAPAANVVIGDPNNNSNMNINGGSRRRRKSKRSTRKRKSRNARKSRK